MTSLDVYIDDQPHTFENFEWLLGLHLCYGSSDPLLYRAGFSVSADRMTLLSVGQIQDSGLP